MAKQSRTSSSAAATATIEQEEQLDNPNIICEEWRMESKDGKPEQLKLLRTVSLQQWAIDELNTHWSPANHTAPMYFPKK